MLAKFDKLNPSPLLCPSILSADFANLAQDVAKIEADADWLHIDLMDGHFVPNLTFGVPIVEAIRRHSNLSFDCHMMVAHPEDYVEALAKAGADGMSVHYETVPHLHRLIAMIKAAGMSAGVALNPATPITNLSEILPELDYVLVMSVNPGFGGQKFIPSSLDKIQRLQTMINDRGLDTLIQVDGGVGLGNIQTVYQAGAKAIVAGSAVFNNENPSGVLKEFRRLCQ